MTHLLCLVGWHKRRPRKVRGAGRTYLLTGVNAWECARCPRKVRIIGESPSLRPR